MEERAWWHRLMRLYQENTQEIDPAHITGARIADDAERLNCNSVIVDAAAIVTFYHTRNPDLYVDVEMGERDFLREIVEACHANGIKVLARNDWHMIRGTVAARRPEWVGRDKNGQPLQWFDCVFTCPSSDYRRAVAGAAFKEQIEEYGVDGIYINGPGFPRNTCYCALCQKDYRSRYGTDIPVDPVPGTEDYRQWTAWRHSVVISMLADQYNAVKAATPRVPYVVDVDSFGGDMVSMARQQDIISAEAFDDLAAPFPDYLGTLQARYMRAIGDGERKPAAVFVSAFPGHSWVKSATPPAELRVWGAAVYLNGCSLWRPWFGWLDGQNDKRGIPVSIEVFKFAKENAAHLEGAEPVAPVAVVWSRRTLDLYGGNERKTRYYDRFFAACGALLESKIPFTIIPDDYLTRDLSKYAALVLPNLACLSDAAAAAVDRYVAAGGGVVATYETALYDEEGHARPDFALECLGVSKAGANLGEWHASDKHTYMRIERPEEPLLATFVNTGILPQKGMFCDVKARPGYRVPLTLIPTEFSQPVELAYIKARTQQPLAVTSDKTVYLCGEIDELFYRFRLPDHRDLLVNAVRAVAGRLPLEVKAPSHVEASLMRNGDETLVCLVNYLGKRPQTEIIPALDLEIALPGVTAASVSSARGNPVRLENPGASGARIKLDRLGAYDLLVVK